MGELSILLLRNASCLGLSEEAGSILSTPHSFGNLQHPETPKQASAP